MRSRIPKGCGKAPGAAFHTLSPLHRGVRGEAVETRLRIGRLYALFVAVVVAGAWWVAMWRGRSHRTDAVVTSYGTRRRVRAHGVAPSTMITLVTCVSPRGVDELAHAAFRV